MSMLSLTEQDGFFMRNAKRTAALIVAVLKAIYAFMSKIVMAIWQKAIPEPAHVMNQMQRTCNVYVPRNLVRTKIPILEQDSYKTCPDSLGQILQVRFTELRLESTEPNP